SGRSAPARCAGLCFGAEPALAAGRIDVGLGVAAVSGNVVQPHALSVDVTLDSAGARNGPGLRRRRLRSAFLAPLPRRRERRTPHTTPGRLRRGLISHVVRAVVAIGERPPLPHEPRADVLSSDATHRDRPPLAVRVARLAGEGTAADVIGQRMRRGLSTPPVAPVTTADLPAFRRVDAVEPDRLAVNLDCVTIADRRDARD